MIKHFLLTAVLAGMSVLPLQAAPLPIKDTVDVVVIGAGPAGLTAAITAKKQGAGVIVLEMENIPGGDGLLAHDGIAAAGTSVQRRLGIKDKPETMYNEMGKNGGERENGELMHILATQSGPALEWLRANGTDLNRVFRADDTQTARLHSPGTGSSCGIELVRALWSLAQRRHLDVRFLSTVDQITFDRGVVTGVQVLPVAGRPYRIRAKAVINATGGYANNPALIRYFAQDKTVPYKSSQAMAYGVGLILNDPLGGDLTAMDALSVMPLSERDTGQAVPREALITGGFIVDSQGRRLVKGVADDKTTADAIMAQPKQQAYLIFDWKTALAVPRLRHFIRNETAKGAPTLVALAEQFSLNEDELKAAFYLNEKRYRKKQNNKFVRKYDEKIFNGAKYYAIIISPAVGSTLGGLRINETAQVLDDRSRPVPGYYAAGEVTGGIHGYDRSEGNALADAIVFGRIAGREAAFFSLKK